jgi:hypothetical protein
MCNARGLLAPTNVNEGRPALLELGARGRGSNVGTVCSDDLTGRWHREPTNEVYAYDTRRQAIYPDLHSTSNSGRWIDIYGDCRDV